MAQEFRPLRSLFYTTYNNASKNGIKASKRSKLHFLKHLIVAQKTFSFKRLLDIGDEAEAFRQPHLQYQVNV